MNSLLSLLMLMGLVCSAHGAEHVPGAGNEQPIANVQVAPQAVSLVQAWALHDAGKLDEAGEMFALVLDKDPASVFALNGLGLTRLKQHRLAEAQVFFEMAAQREADNTFCRTWLAVLALRRNQPGAAMKLLHEVLGHDPDHPDALYLMGSIKSTEHDMAGAVTYFSRVTDSGRADTGLLVRLARSYAGLGMMANARLAYEQALALDPDHTGGLNGLGWLLWEAQLREEALNTWQRALELKSDEARSNLAAAYGLMAQEAAAARDMAAQDKYWTMVQKLDPGNRAARQYLRKNPAGTMKAGT